MKTIKVNDPIFESPLGIASDPSVIWVDDDIKNKTIECEKDFACISDKDYKLCKVIRSTNKDKIIFIECLEKSSCSYKMSFGFSTFICNCPMRKEIYGIYEI